MRVPAFCPSQALGKDVVCSDCPWECGELSRGILGKRCLQSRGRGKGYFKKHPWGRWVPLFPVESYKDNSVSYLKFLWLPGVLSGVLSRTELQKPPHLVKISKYETSYSEDRDTDDAVLANVTPTWGNATIRAQCLSEDHAFQSVKFPSLYRQGSVFKPRDQAGCSLGSHSGSCIFTDTGIWSYCCTKPSSPAGLSQQPGQELVLISWPGRGSGAEHKARDWGPPGVEWIKQMRDRAMGRRMTTKAPSHQGGGIVSFQPGYCQKEHRPNCARTSNSYLKELRSLGPHRNSANL